MRRESESESVICSSAVYNARLMQGHYAPDHYEPLQNMRVLRLGSNALHTLNPDFFEHLPNLEEVYLDSNPFKVIDRNTHSAITSVPLLKVGLDARGEIEWFACSSPRAVQGCRVQDAGPWPWTRTARLWCGG